MTGRRQLLAAVATSVLLAMQAMTPSAGATEQRRMTCLSNAESRDAMQAKSAVPPFRATAEALRDGGDLVAIKLCRSAETVLVYDVAILRRDGHLVHVLVDAATGTVLPARR